MLGKVIPVREGNPHYADNPEYFEQIVRLLEEFPKSYARKIGARGRNREKTKFRPYSHLYDWIVSRTQKLCQERKLQTRITWIVYGFEDFPKCERCRRSERYVKRDVSPSRPYSRFCCLSCSQNDPATRQKAKETALERYGDPNYRNTDKMKNTVAETLAENPDFYAERREKSKKTYMKRYGVDHNMKCQNGLEEYSESMLVRHGARFSTQSAEIREIIAGNNVEKYGRRWYVETDEFKGKARKTMLETYGVEYPGQSDELMANARKPYLYEGMYFKTTPELAFYIWVKDSGLNIEYQPKCEFTYNAGGKTRKYMPDFKVDGEIIEVKGSQFVKEDGTWQNPYDHSQDPIYEAKRQCCLRNGVRIMYENEYREYVKYVERVYGTGFFSQCRKQAICEREWGK